MWCDSTLGAYNIITMIMWQVKLHAMVTIYGAITNVL